MYHTGIHIKGKLEPGWLNSLALTLVALTCDEVNCTGPPVYGGEPSKR